MANDGRLKRDFKVNLTKMVMVYGFGVFFLSHLLACFQLIVAWIANSYIKFKAHNWNIDAIAGAFIANGFATIATMMLPNADLPLIHHGT